MQFIPIALAVVQGVSALSKAGAESSRLEAQARINEYNAAITAQRAETTRSVYNSREDSLRRKQALFMGKQRATAAESGAGLGGSNADVLRQSEIESELDALSLRYEGDLEARGLLAQSDAYRTEASFSRSQKSSARMGGWLGVGAAALSGTSSYLRGGFPNAGSSDYLRGGFSANTLNMA